MQLQGLLLSHLAMAVDEFKQRSFLYLQPNAPPPAAADAPPPITILTWGELAAQHAATSPLTITTLPATDDTPHREGV